MRKLLPVIFIFLIFNGSAQVFQLKVKLNGGKDQLLILANYFADKQYITDTLKRDKSGWYVLEADSILPGGLYIVAGENKNRYFEFLINKEPRMVFEADAQDPVNTLKIKGSKENTAFIEYVKYLSARQKEIEPLQKAYKRTETAWPDSASFFKKEIERINKEVVDYMNTFEEKNQGTFAAAFVKASREPNIPETPKLPDGKPDSLFPYRYYKAHYFDNLPLDDARLLRTPFYHQRVNNYFTKMVIQHPDSIIAEVKRWMPVARRSKDTYRYMVWFLTNHTERSEIMGMDAAFVYMVENYYATGDMDYWINQTVKENLVKKAKKLKPILLGKTAPELIMLDTLMRPVSLHAVKAKYTIVLFWDPTCGHCKKEIPHLVDFMQRRGKEHDIQVFAVCSDTNMREMKKYIRQLNMNWINVNGPRAYTPNYHDLYDIYSTPVLYLLDERKTILAKRLMTDQIETFIERHSRNETHGVIQMQEN